MTTNERLERLLSEKGIRPTALRILIFRTLQEKGNALSPSDLEAELKTVDKSTIYRTLSVLLQHTLIHSIDDGEGITKYGACADGCTCNAAEHSGFSDLHLHFTCEHCHRTYCFRGMPVPKVSVPEGFQIHSANYMLIGLCPACEKYKH